MSAKKVKRPWDEILSEWSRSEWSSEFKASSFDPVNRPRHYCKGGIEAIDVIEAFELGLHEGNALAYLLRAKYKGEERQDLEKAIWYLNRRLDQLETGEKSPPESSKTK